MAVTAERLTKSDLKNTIHRLFSPQKGMKLYTAWAQGDFESIHLWIVFYPFSDSFSGYNLEGDEVVQNALMEQPAFKSSPMDRVKVNNDLEIRVDFKQLPDMYALNFPIDYAEFEKHLPFERGNLIIENIPIKDNYTANLKLFFTISDRVLKFKIYAQSPPLTNELYMISEFDFKTGVFKVIQEPVGPNGKSYEENDGKTLFAHFYTVMVAIAAEPTRIQVKSKTHPMTAKNKKGKKKLSSVITITGVLKEYVGDPESEKTKQERQKYVESWGVRGHFRKMKSGKSVWIRPHKKGAGESIKQTYVLGK